MALHNLGKNHDFTANLSIITAALDALEQSLNGRLIDLAPEDRQKYGSISEQNKLLVNKVQDYHRSQPQHSAPEVDWVEFEADYASRQALESAIMRMASLTRQMESTKILHDYDNYQDALADYAYAQYRADRNIPGAADKVGNLRQFFARTGTTNKNTTDDTNSSVDDNANV